LELLLDSHDFRAYGFMPNHIPYFAQVVSSTFMVWRFYLNEKILRLVFCSILPLPVCK